MDPLFQAAIDVRENARAAYSGFKVGAALQSSTGAVFTGCNIENSTYGLTVCAERVAVFKALSEGHSTFTRIVVATGAATLTPPCGACRQILWEFCGDIEVILVNLEGRTESLHMKNLFPRPFDAANLS